MAVGYNVPVTSKFSIQPLVGGKFVQFNSLTSNNENSMGGIGFVGARLKFEIDDRNVFSATITGGLGEIEGTIKSFNSLAGNGFIKSLASHFGVGVDYRFKLNKNFSIGMFAKNDTYVIIPTAASIITQSYVREVTTAEVQTYKDSVSKFVNDTGMLSMRVFFIERRGIGMP